MKTIKELEADLNLANLKLEKMTATVKQLGTKLNRANQESDWSKQEANHYRVLHSKLHAKVSQLVLSRDECHERANEINSRNF